MVLLRYNFPTFKFFFALILWLKYLVLYFEMKEMLQSTTTMKITL